MRRMNGKVVLVVGVGNDAVEAIAPALGRAGATVVLGADRLDRLRATVDEIEAAGGTALAHRVDVASRDEVAAFAAGAITALDDGEPTWEDAEWQ